MIFNGRCQRLRFLTPVPQPVTLRKPGPVVAWRAESGTLMLSDTLRQMQGWLSMCADLGTRNALIALLRPEKAGACANMLRARARGRLS